jgi:hypothetical protein
MMQVRQQSQKTEKLLIDSVMQEQTFVATALEEQAARLEDQAPRLATQLDMSVRAAETSEREQIKANIEDSEVVAEVTTRWFAVSQTLEEGASSTVPGYVRHGQYVRDSHCRIWLPIFRRDRAVGGGKKPD